MTKLFFKFQALALLAVGVGLEARGEVPSEGFGPVVVNDHSACVMQEGFEETVQSRCRQFKEVPGYDTAPALQEAEKACLNFNREALEYANVFCSYIQNAKGLDASEGQSELLSAGNGMLEHLDAVISTFDKEFQSRLEVLRGKSRVYLEKLGAISTLASQNLTSELRCIDRSLSEIPSLALFNVQGVSHEALMSTDKNLIRVTRKKRADFQKVQAQLREGQMLDRAQLAAEQSGSVQELLDGKPAAKTSPKSKAPLTGPLADLHMAMRLGIQLFTQMSFTKMGLGPMAGAGAGFAYQETFVEEITPLDAAGILLVSLPLKAFLVGNIAFHGARVVSEFQEGKKAKLQALAAKMLNENPATKSSEVAIAFASQQGHSCHFK